MVACWWGWWQGGIGGDGGEGEEMVPGTTDRVSMLIMDVFGEVNAPILMLLPVFSNFPLFLQTSPLGLYVETLLFLSYLEILCGVRQESVVVL